MVKYSFVMNQEGAQPTQAENKPNRLFPLMSFLLCMAERQGHSYTDGAMRLWALFINSTDM